MNTFKSILNFLLLCLSFQVYAQNNNDVLVTINDSTYNVADFERLYTKNIDIITDESQKDIDHYFNLYKLYKLRLQKAYELKLNESDKITHELNSFRKELAEKYFINENDLNNLLNEAIERSKYEINASHILVKVNEYATANDTLAAYNKIINIREQLLNGLNFEEAALKYSDDLSAKTNKGNLGYFSVFRMVYPFENGAFNTNVGEISMPIRTNFGYHLIKVNNKRKTPKTKNIAHILIESKDINDGEAKKKIDEVYKRLQLGDVFSDMALHFSEDQSTREKGGDLGIYNEGSINIDGISEIVYDLNFIGAYSKPFFSQYGWHIIAVTNIKDVPTTDQLKKMFLPRIKSDSRSKVLEKNLLNHLKDLYQYKIYSENIEKASLLLNREDMFLTPKVEENNQTNGTIASYADKNITVKNILEHIYNYPKLYAAQETNQLVILKALDNYSLRLLKQEYDHNLETNFPDFANTMREYKEGLLLFELLEKEIWNKTANDTIALQNHYEINKDNYIQPEYFIGEVYVFEKRTDAKTYYKLLKNNIDFKEDDFPMIYKYQGRFNLNDKRLPTNLELQNIGKKVEKYNNLYYVFNVRERKATYTPTYDEIKNKVLSDYQLKYENDYNENLLKLAKVEINTAVINQLKTKYNKKNHNKN